MKTPRSWQVAFFLVLCSLAGFGCQKSLNQINVEQLSQLNPKGSFPSVKMRSAAMMSESTSCTDIVLEATVPSYLSYIHNGELVELIWGPRCEVRETGRIIRKCDGNILLECGFAYMHIGPIPVPAGSGANFTATAPSTDSEVTTGPRPWLKTVRVRTTGVGSTWAIEIDDNGSGSILDRIYFIDGIRVDIFSETTNLPPGDPLNSATKKSFLTYTKPTPSTEVFSAEAPIVDDVPASYFAACVTPYACFWGLPAPNPCPPLP